MKKTLLAFLPLLLVLLSAPAARSQCHALFTWEQIPGTLQIHFHSTSTSEHDIISYAWTFGDGGTSDGQNPYHTYAVAGTYNVCLVITDNVGCVSDICHEVTVNPVNNECHAGFTWAQVAGTLSIAFTNTSTSGHDIISYSWNFGDTHTGDGQNPTHTYATAGTYNVCLVITDNVGCVSDICHEVTVAAVEPACHAGFTWDQVGNSLVVDFTNTSTSQNDIISYSWTFGDGGTGDGANPSHTYNEAGTYVVCLIIHDSEGCVSDVCHEVHVEAAGSECHADFTWEQIPGTNQIHFHNTSTSNSDIISFQWNFGDGSTGDGANPYHTYDEPGTYTVCLIIHNAGGCVSDICYQVIVEAAGSECHASFTWEQIPGSLQIHFNSTSTSNHDIVSYQWTFGDGGTASTQDPYHTYDQPGTYVVCLIITDNTGCTSDVCVEVHVEAAGSECHADFTWEQIPGTQQIHYHSTSTSNHDIVSYSWNFGDGSTGDGANPYHTYEQPGTYVVCLVITDNTGCVSDICHEVHVEAPGTDCHADFTWEQIPGTLQIHYHSTSTSNHDIISYLWNFGDNHTGDGANPYHTYAEPGTYVVCLTITDASGCVSEICHEVHVEAAGAVCHADFTWEQLQDSLAIHFHSTSTSNHDIISYSWNFGDGSTGDGANPYHTYDQPGTYVVCLVITDNTGCVSDICHEVHVEGPAPACHAGFNWDQIDTSHTVQFVNTSTSAHDIISYQWNFGDGQTSDSANPSHTYAEYGTYVVCLIITDNTGCVSDVCHEIHISATAASCHADFNWEQLPGTLQIHFHSTSTSEHDIVSYMWSFGDGHNGDAHNPYHTYDQAGTYLVCLTITDASGCVSDTCHEITVEQPECNATFTFTVNDAGVVHFNNHSTGGTEHTTWTWDFGDGETGHTYNAEHVYDEPGIYTACLYMSDTTIDCLDTFCVTFAYQMSYEDLHNDNSVGQLRSSAHATIKLTEDFKVIRYTNPAADQLIIDFNMDQVSTVSFELHDLTGYRMVSDKTGLLPVGKQKEIIDISHLQSGLYILTVTTGTQRKTMSLTIAR